MPATIAGIDLRLDGPVAADVSDAEQALLQLQAVGQQVAGFEALARSLLRSEAVASSWVEGLDVSHRKLAEAERDAPGATYDEARRVLANIRAMIRAIQIGGERRDLQVDDLLSMHGMLMSGSTRHEDQERAGELRAEPVFIGGTTPQTAEYVGPPHGRLDALLDDLVAFINGRTDLPPVAAAALAHAQFESIHPFHDGNGRVGRCLIHTMLRRAELCETAFAPISVIVARRGGAYVDGLNAFRRDNLDDWISFFATTVRTAAETAVEFGREVDRLEQQWNRRIIEHREKQGRRPPRSDALIGNLLQELPAIPVFKVNDVVDHFEVTWRTADTAVQELEQTRVVSQVTAGRRNRVYEALELFDLIEEYENDPTRFASDARSGTS